MMRLWNCDDDGGQWDDSHLCWEEIEECAPPMYWMWKDKLDGPTWKPPRQTLVLTDGWMNNLC